MGFQLLLFGRELRASLGDLPHPGNQLRHTLLGIRHENRQLQDIEAPALFLGNRRGPLMQETLHILIQLRKCLFARKQFLLNRNQRGFNGFQRMR